MPENCSKKPVFKVKIAYLWVEFSPRRRQVGQNLMRRLERKFSVHSEYRIRFSIAFTVLEIQSDLWTPLWPFSAKMSTLWMNISRTDKAFDLRFFANASYRSPLLFANVLAKSLEPFPRKSRKTSIFTGFSRFSADSAFFRKIRPCHFFYFINV